MGVWKYTAAEKRAIEEAYVVCRLMADLRGRERLLDGCVKIERRERSCITAARWLVAEAFARGFHANPEALEFAWTSVGLQQAILIGAGIRRHGPWENVMPPEMADIVRGMDAAFAAALAAQGAYMDRGLDRAAVPFPAPAKKAKPGAALRDAIGKSIQLHRDEKGGA